jgi:hypothetical protein
MDDGGQVRRKRPFLGGKIVANICSPCSNIGEPGEAVHEQSRHLADAVADPLGANVSQRVSLSAIMRRRLPSGSSSVDIC